MTHPKASATGAAVSSNPRFQTLRGKRVEFGMVTHQEPCNT